MRGLFDRVFAIFWKDILSELLTKEIGKTNKELKNAIEEVNK